MEPDDDLRPDSSESKVQYASGQLTINKKVVKLVIHRVASGVPGVLQLGGDSIWKKLFRRLGIRQGPRGIELELGHGEAAMTLTLVVSIAANLPKLAATVRHRVKRALREQLGIEARTVNIYVKSVKGRLRRSSPEAAGLNLLMGEEPLSPYEDLDHEALRDLERRPRFDVDDELGL
jgi:uncharacterized alkaline shock family protein YloU